MKYIKPRTGSFLSESVQNTKSYEFNKLTENDLKEIAEWGLLGPYSESGCWDDDCDQLSLDDLPIAVGRALEDFELFLNTPYPIELGNIPHKPIIYRLVRLDNETDLDMSDLGSSWFSNPEQYRKPEFYDMLDYLLPSSQSHPGKTYLLTGECVIDNIDVKHTLWERSIQWSENEIVIIDPSKITLLSCTLIKNFTYL